VNASTPDLKSVFSKALEISDPGERARYLAEACGEDRRFRCEVESLLGALGKAGSFLEASAPRPGPTVAGPVREGPGTAVGPYKLLEQLGEGGFRCAGRWP
jgi:serine/threonine-protein kinase